MQTRHLTLKLLCAAMLTALVAAPVAAQTTAPTGTTTTIPSKPETRLGTEFTGFAGSDANSEALVTGLRDGTAITLTETTTSTTGTAATTTTTFQPDTGKLGVGNVKIALSLADASLSKAGITNPTPAEIEAALNGGTLVLADGTSIDLKGVLASRAAGEGWGQIAKSMGLKLGDVMRSPKAAGHAAAGAHVHAKVDKVELAHGKSADHTDHPSRPDHASRVDRPDRPTKPDRPDHPDHTGRPGG